MVNYHYMAKGDRLATFESERVRDAQLPEPSRVSSTGEPIDIERVPMGSERGGWKSTYWDG